MSDQPRVPGGSSSGGRFSGHHRSDADADQLAEPAWPYNISDEEWETGYPASKERWANFVELSEDGGGPEAIMVVPVARFYIHDEESGGRWSEQHPATWCLSAPKYNDYDGVVGSTISPLPAAQQYGLKAQTWLRRERESAEAERAAESHPGEPDYEPF
jgi:hypothetical protein